MYGSYKWWNPRLGLGNKGTGSTDVIWTAWSGLGDIDIPTCLLPLSFMEGELAGSEGAFEEFLVRCCSTYCRRHRSRTLNPATGSSNIHGPIKPGPILSKSLKPTFYMTSLSNLHLHVVILFASNTLYFCTFHILVTHWAKKFLLSSLTDLQVTILLG